MNSKAPDTSETETTTAPEPEKTELTADEFAEAVSNTEGFTFKTEMNTEADDLALFPYEGLQACVLVVHDDANVASFFVFDTEENADKVIRDTKDENTTGYNAETGKNFEMLKEGPAVVERVGATVMNISTDNESMTKAILKATEY